MIRVLLLGLAMLFAAWRPAYAVMPNEVLADPALEARAREISGQLRCMVCQNQSIDDSDAPLAHDLRVLVRERLKDGDSDDAVRSYLTSRYGDFILLKPPLNWATALLWVGPGALLILGAIGVMTWARRRHAVDVTPDLSGQERAALARLLVPDASADPGVH